MSKVKAASGLVKVKLSSTSQEPNKKEFLPDQQLYVFQIHDHSTSYHSIIL